MVVDNRMGGLNIWKTILFLLITMNGTQDTSVKHFLSRRKPFVDELVLLF